MQVLAKHKQNDLLIRNRKTFIEEVRNRIGIPTSSDGFILNTNNWIEVNRFQKIQQFPYSHWKSTSNQRKFIEEIALKLNIIKPSDWGSISVRRVFELGGTSLLDNYQGSLFRCLKTIYKGKFAVLSKTEALEINWKRDWFTNISKASKSHWKSTENQRKLLDDLQVKLKIKKPSDWGKVTLIQVHELGGSYLLRQYNNSLFRCLQSIYKGIAYYNLNL